MMSQKAKDHGHEAHRVNRINWVRAAILGANDGILSIASIMTGMASAHSPREVVLLAGIAGLVAGATSMATGEYISVSSQADIEAADINRERRELIRNPEFEKEELAQIYVERGLDEKLAREVAVQLMNKDALGAHARDELGLSEISQAKPLQAAMASAGSFTVGGLLPLFIALIAPQQFDVLAVAAGSLMSLALLGVVSGKVGGVGIWKPTLRTLFWGGLSMGLTALIGNMFGVN